ncbi:MAG: hypothetical protein GXY83_26805 [Rhodopirellula sp.]|nr:hypothetical protein [Rhodopirellula sp.]
MQTPKTLTHRYWFLFSSIGLLAATAVPAPATEWKLENQYVRYVIGGDGRNVHFTDPRDGEDHLAAGDARPCAQVKIAGKQIAATEAIYADGKLAIAFGDCGVRAVVGVDVRPHYLVFEVLAVEGPEIEELTIVEVPLALKGTPEESFAGCALALNLKTKVPEIPRANSRLRAFCYPRFGLVGAKVALVGCPQDELRQVLQEVVNEADELPKSAIGGPFALGQAINQGSYLFNFSNLSEDKADDWIALCKTLGMNQIDFHGGSSFRFGDCEPNPLTYPNGKASLKAVIDKLHGAGIAAGLHTYAFFIAKNCPWVTPVPDPRLAKDATLTLAEAIAAEGDAVRVAEATTDMSAITGFFVRNSVTLQIDDELITYTGIDKQSPYGFTGCRRGAYGTKAVPHAAGAKVHHLKECFGLFVPDPETTLLAEVAAKTAEAFNTCGFDMIYLDALDGEDILGGRENGWHYGSKFVYEIFKRLDRPALMEMSTFHHHLWIVRARLGAWDHPTRSHKKFIDMHCQANEQVRRMFLPGQLGWWAFKTWTGPQGEPTFPDDIEYLMGKCLGTDTGFSLMGIDPSNIGTVAALPRLAAIIRRYEDLRHSGKVPDSVKAKLRVAGDEFRLVGSLEEGWHFLPVRYSRHKVTGAAGPDCAWKVTNDFAPQPVKLRIEALMGAGPYDAAENTTVVDFEAAQFPARAAQANVAADLTTSRDVVKVGGASGCYTATNSRPAPEGSWAKVETTFDPPLNLGPKQALGLWVHGDGQQEVLNVQLRSPSHISHGIGDHYIPIDFTGWRYFELIEPEGERHADYQWPYGGTYSIYRESVNFGQVQSLGLWYNNLPPGKPVTCHIGPIKAMPLVPIKLVNPVVTVGGASIRFPVEMATGSYLEFFSPDDCKLYGPTGELIQEVKPEGPVPTLAGGDNEVAFACEAAGANPRTRVTVISHGEAMP